VSIYPSFFVSSSLFVSDDCFFLSIPSGGISCSEQSENVSIGRRPLGA